MIPARRNSGVSRLQLTQENKRLVLKFAVSLLVTIFLAVMLGTL